MNFRYSTTEAWFECTTIDKFVEQLKELTYGENTVAELYDMDREIIYQFTIDEIELSINRTNSDLGSGQLKFSTDYEHELVCQKLNVCSVSVNG